MTSYIKEVGIAPPVGEGKPDYTIIVSTAPTRIVTQPYGPYMVLAGETVETEAIEVGLVREWFAILSNLPVPCDIYVDVSVDGDTWAGMNAYTGIDVPNFAIPMTEVSRYTYIRFKIKNNSTEDKQVYITLGMVL